MRCRGVGGFVALQRDERKAVATYADNLKISLCFHHDGLGFAKEGIIGTEFEHGDIVVIRGLMMNMTKKLHMGLLHKSENVKLAFAYPASMKADLDRYATPYALTYGGAFDAVALIPRTREVFMEGDQDSGKYTSNET